jgi:transcriptional regulator with XRE-family HTH domain
MSQSELARRIGAKAGYICDLENNRRSVRLGTIARIAEALNVSPASLVSTVRTELHQHKKKLKRTA